MILQIIFIFLETGYGGLLPCQISGLYLIPMGKPGLTVKLTLTSSL